MISLDANIRNTKTKGELSLLRNNGGVPAVIYGGEAQNETVSISKKLLKSLIDKENFLLMGAIGSEVKDYQWLEWHSDDYDVVIENLTESWGGLLLTGPNARKILSQCTQEDLSNDAFSWLSCKTIKIDSASVFAMRVSYAGELGWELHMPTWQLISIYESLMEMGEKFG